MQAFYKKDKDDMKEPLLMEDVPPAGQETSTPEAINSEEPMRTDGEEPETQPPED